MMDDSSASSKKVPRSWVIDRVEERTSGLVTPDPNRTYSERGRFIASGPVDDPGHRERMKRLKEIVLKAERLPEWLDESDVIAAVEEIVEAVRVAVGTRIGRRNHPAKEWYLAQGRKIRPMGSLQSQMAKAVGHAPNEKTIREWEKEFGW